MLRAQAVPAICKGISAVMPGAQRHSWPLLSALVCMLSSELFLFDSALASLEARVAFTNHITTTTASDDLAVWMA
jgi:hypothetical protein